MNEQEEKLLIESTRNKQAKILIYGSAIWLCLFVGIILNLNLREYIKYDLYHEVCAGLGQLAFNFFLGVIFYVLLFLTIFLLCLFEEIKLTRNKISLGIEKSLARKHLVKYIIISIIVGILYSIIMVIIASFITGFISNLFDLKYKGGCTL